MRSMRPALSVRVGLRSMILRLRSAQILAPSGKSLPEASAIWSIWGLAPSVFIGSFQSAERRGLESANRPLVPNTATASDSELMVSRCTLVMALLADSSSRRSVRSSKT
ncbi:hypothetical protein D3C86_1891540 [compost metagenome]